MRQIDAMMYYTSVTGLTQSDIQSVKEVVTDTGKQYYEMRKDKKLFSYSYPQLDRLIMKLNDHNRSESIIKVNNKKFVSSTILEHSKRKGLIPELVEDAGLKIVIDSDLLKEDYEFLVTGATVQHTGVLYFDIEQSQTYLGVTESEVRGLIARINERYRYEYCLSIASKHYVSPLLLMLAKPTLSHLRNINYAQFVARYAWSTCGSVRFDRDMSADACSRLMTGLFNKLKRSYPNTFNYFFYVTEQNPGQDGHHNHFIYGNHSFTPEDEIKRVIKTYLAKKGGWHDRAAEIEGLNPRDFFIEYMVKEIHHLPDHYNWLHHNLVI